MRGMVMTPTELGDLFVDNARCPRHPRYKRKRQPRVLCTACWFLYFLEALREKGKMTIKVVTRGEK